MFAVKRLGNGWRLLRHCQLGVVPLEFVLICPGAGVALLEVEPVWTPQAPDHFRARLAEVDFASRFPGHLPVIHRRLHVGDLPALQMLLAEAFVWLDPLTIEAPESWEDEVEALLTPSPAELGRANAAPAHTALLADGPMSALLPEARSLLVAHQGPAPSPTIISVVAAPQPAKQARLRSEAWTGIAAAGIAAVAFLSLSSQTPPGTANAPTPVESAAAEAPVEPAAAEAPVEPTAAEAPASATPQMSAVVAEPETPPAEPMMVVAAQPIPDPPVVTMVEPPVPLDATLPPTPMEPAATLPAWIEGTPELPDGRSASLWETVAEYQRMTPPADPAESQALSVSSRPLPPEEVKFVEPAPEPDVLEGIPFWTQPRPDAEHVEPLRGDMPVQEAPVAMPPPPTPPPVASQVAPPLAGTAPDPPMAASRPPPEPPPAQPATAAPVVVRPAPVMSPSEIEAARRRGEALAALGDFSGARRFLERAALAGSGAAAMAMAESFDPRVLAQRGVIGLRGDRAAALVWYRRALALGVAASAARITALEAEK